MNFLKTTFIGGVLFLIPITICVLILGKVHGLMAKIAAPLATWVPVDHVGGIAVANLLAVVALVLICFLAGLLSSSRLASWLVGKLESGLLQFIPGYTFIKGLTGGLAGDDEEHQLVPVLVKFDDYSQIAFRVERLPDGKIVIFVPGAPDPWSGSILIVEERRVQALDRKLAAAVRNIRALGRGSQGLLENVIGELDS